MPENLLRERLDLSEDAESPAYLNAGLVHDLCNLLAAALLNVELARMEAPDQPRLAAMAEACMQAAELGRRMNGGGNSLPRRLSAHALLANAIDLLGPRLRAPWSVQARFHATLDRIQGDRAALLSACMNLILNACEAMPQGGQLSIETGGVDLEQGPGLWIRFSDEGEGIPEELRQRLFEPYFSTKPQGRGLGLAMVERTARVHGGWVQAGPGAGGGTQVTLTLPLAA